MNQTLNSTKVSMIAKAIELSEVTQALPTGSYSVFSPTKEATEMAVHVLRGRFTTNDLAELLWNASLTDDEIEFFTLFESAEG